MAKKKKNIPRGKYRYKVIGGPHVDRHTGAISMKGKTIYSDDPELHRTFINKYRPLDVQPEEDEDEEEEEAPRAKKKSKKDRKKGKKSKGKKDRKKKPKDDDEDEDKSKLVDDDE